MLVVGKDDAWVGSSLVSKRTSLLRCGVNNRGKKFSGLGPWTDLEDDHAGGQLQLG